MSLGGSRVRNDDEDAVADKDEAARTVMQNWSGGNGFSLALEKDKDDKSVVNQEKPLFRSANGQQEGEELVLGDRTIQRQEIELHSSSSFGEETGNIVPFELDADVGELDEINAHRCCGCCKNENVRVLWLMFVANTCFTIAQFIGAYLADSLAMYGDCSTMALDSFTYILNIYTEKQKSKGNGNGQTAKLEIAVASVSIITLAGVTAYLLWDAILRLDSPHNKRDVVNADIMLEFSIGNLFIDIFSCAIFLSRIIQEQKEQRKLKRYATSNGTQAENVDFEMHKAFVQDWEQMNRINEDGYAENDDNNAEEESDLNMTSAFVHLAADTLRTITVMVTALIVDLTDGNVDSLKADAVSSIVVSVIILFVAIFLIVETCHQYKKLSNYHKYQIQESLENIR